MILSFDKTYNIDELKHCCQHCIVIYGAPYDPMPEIYCNVCNYNISIRWNKISHISIRKSNKNIFIYKNFTNINFTKFLDYNIIGNTFNINDLHLILDKRMLLL